MVETAQSLRSIIYSSEAPVVEVIGLLELLKYELITSAAMTQKQCKAG